MIRAKTVAVFTRLCQLDVAQTSRVASPVMSSPVFEAGLLRDRLCRRRIVAGNHDSFDAGRPAFADRIDDAGAQRIGKADKPKKFERQFTRRSRPIRPGMRGAGDAQHAQSGSGHRVDGLRQGRAVGGTEPAKACNRFGGALGGDDVILPIAVRCQIWVTASRSGRRP